MLILQYKPGTGSGGNNEPTGDPVILGSSLGSVDPGDTLAVDTSSISDADGLGPFAYQWTRDGIDIDGATGEAYTVTNDDQGSVIAIRVSWVDGQSNAESLTSSTTVSSTSEDFSPTHSLQRVITDNTGVYFAGHTGTEGDGTTQASLFKYDSLGSIQWQRMFETFGGGLYQLLGLDANGSSQLVVCGVKDDDTLTSGSDGLIAFPFTDGSGTATYGSTGTFTYQVAAYPEDASLVDTEIDGGGGPFDPPELSFGSYTTDTTDATAWTDSAGTAITGILPTSGAPSSEFFVGTFGSEVKSIKYDGSGDVYLVGNTFGGGEIQIAKYNTTTESYDWQRKLSSAGTDQGIDCDVDGSGNLYVLGTDGSDQVIAKYNNTGTIQWKKTFVAGLGEITNARGITVDSSGNVYVAGNSVTSNEGVIVKLDTSGVFVFGSTHDSTGWYSKISLDNSNNIVATGTLDSLTDRMVISKWNSSGIHQWTLKVGSGSGETADNVTGVDVTADTTDNVYAIGTIDGNTSHIFKTNSSGSVQWKREISPELGLGGGGEGG